MFSNTFAGIAPSPVPAFVVAEVIGGIGGIVAIVVIKVLYPDLTRDEAADIMVPGHDFRGAASRHLIPFTRCGP
jgi:arsenate reductase